MSTGITALNEGHSDIQNVVRSFALHGDFVSVSAYGSGHINSTFVVAMNQAGVTIRYIIQRINDRIFKDPVALMENVCRVTGEAADRLRAGGIPDASRRTLTVVPTWGGEGLLRTPEGEFWRCYLFIEGAKTYDMIETPAQALAASRAFGEFQKLVSGLRGPRLHETITGFHDTRARFARLSEVAGADPLGRLAGASAEWDFARAHEDITGVLLDLQASGEIPERVTHNDTKLNNVMMDEASGEGVCVVDLDTVMPGLALYDFGDMVRTATSPAAEDERDLSKVGMMMPMFEALVRGYLSSTSDMLTEAECANLAFSGKLITLEIGLRFLTDYLEGDVYFKTTRPEHNLDRCRTQFALVRSIEAQEDAMKRFVDSACL